MQIVETSVFTRLINDLMDDETCRMLRIELITEPENGSPVPGSGGLREIRWKLEGRGKRGGFRNICHWAGPRGKIVMLHALPRNERDDLSKEQIEILRHMVESEFK